MFDASRCRPDLERPRLFAYGKHDLHLGPASRPPDRTWGHGTPWVCPKRVLFGSGLGRSVDGIFRAAPRKARLRVPYVDSL
eukprot:scaffold83509_cov40-Phaeocystis_antarctica.AAC.1